MYFLIELYQFVMDMNNKRTVVKMYFNCLAYLIKGIL